MNRRLICIETMYQFSFSGVLRWSPNKIARQNSRDVWRVIFQDQPKLLRNRNTKIFFD